MKDQWLCVACKWTGQECDIRKEIIFVQTREETEEWEWYCTDCNKTDTLEEDDKIWCKTCEDVIVKDEGDQCTECYTEECERHVDAARGH